MFKRTSRKTRRRLSRAEQQRRSFLRAAFLSCAFVALQPLAFLPLVRSWQSRLRPPGALDEERLLAACIKCGQCVQVCPVEAIELADIGDGLGVGIPFIDARKQACDFSCDAISCVLACPTGALSHDVASKEEVHAGLARLTRPDACLARQGKGFSGKARGDAFTGRLRYEDVEVDGKKLKLGILELPSFYGDSADPDERQSAQDVAKLLAEANEAEVDGLILDLSRNGGGLLEQAVTISGFFLRTGEIVRVEARRGQQQPYFDPDESILYSGPMVVHTSRMSASASEILAGALKDYGRAVIAGDDHTFGKGTVQSVQALPPGQGAFKITTAMFFLPGGWSTQHSGVEADVVIPSLFSNNDLGEKTQRYSLPPNQVAPFLSESANGTLAGMKWQPLSDEVLSTLSAKSRSRVEASEEFDEIREKAKEQQEAGSLMRLADILKDQSIGASDKDEDVAVEEDDTAESDEDEVVTTAELREAVRVLADLIVLTGDPSQLVSQTP